MEKNSRNQPGYSYIGSSFGISLSVTSGQVVKPKMDVILEAREQKHAEVPAVSVIITSFHGEYLDETLLSIDRMLEQSKVSAEIILYDDASNNEINHARLERLQEHYSDILQIYYGKTNLGPARGRTEAIKHARAPYLLIFDDDDIMLPFDLAGELAYLDEHPETPMSYSQKFLFSRERGYLEDVHGGPLSLFEAFFAPKVNINGAIIRKEALTNVGGFLPVGGDPKVMNEDTELIIRLELTGPLYYSHEPRCFYRVHPRQLTAVSAPWPEQVTKGPCERNPDLYQRILQGDIPDVHGENFRLVRGLMGAAFYFNQRNRTITTPIIQTALQEFSDDFGVWDIYLYTLAQDGKLAELRRVFDYALNRFHEIPIIGILLIQPLIRGYQAARQQIPEDVTQLMNKLRIRHLELPEIVKQGFQKYGIRY